MLRASLMLAAIPPVIFAVAGPSTPPPPIKPVAVRTEGIREQRQDDETFRRRWSPIYDAPPAIEVRYAAAVSQQRSPQADAADTVTRPAPQPQPRYRLKSK